MWRRSQVEQLTGLSRHMIQDLCNPNTAKDGLAFWTPAVSKPGYSQFDEGDLMMFYLVKQIYKAGFSITEVEQVMVCMFDDAVRFDALLNGKVSDLEREQRQLDEKLLYARLLGSVTRCGAEDRAAAMMSLVLHRKLDDALGSAAREVRLLRGEERVVRRRAQAVLEALLALVGWGPADRGPGSPADVPEDLKRWLSTGLADFRREVGRLLGDGRPPEDRETQYLITRASHELAHRCFGIDADGPTCCGHTERYLICAVRSFLNDPENGAPVELVFGKDSFAFLNHAFNACALAEAPAGAREKGHRDEFTN